MQALRAIETQYNGYRFRSRLEARWAVFFDALGVKYEYEREGFALDAGWYLPDFWLPDLETWVEIKPEFPLRTERLKLRELAVKSECDVLLCYRTDFRDAYFDIDLDDPFFGMWCGIFQPDFPIGDDSTDGVTLWKECGCCVLAADRGLCDYGATYVGIAGSMAWDEHMRRSHSEDRTSSPDMTSRLDRAYAAARSARFEFGEKGRKL